MIISARLRGGMGNQMFQYAHARALALAHHAELVMDTTQLHKKRTYALGGFRLSDRVVAEDHRVYTNVVKEGVPAATIKTDTTTLGYWESYKHFPPDHVLWSDFELKEPGPPLDPEGKTTIAVHVRRGDKAGLDHGNCEMPYYSAVYEAIMERIPAPRSFRVFSDDPGWAAENIRFGADEIRFSSRSPLEDFESMMQCHHSVIVNSTFGWWAAWLNKNPDKIVFAPSRWYLSKPHDIDDIIPPSWVKVDPGWS